eukprot:1322537-Amorphochlora_amoeboformis.AAC.1
MEKHKGITQRDNTTTFASKAARSCSLRTFAYSHIRMFAYSHIRTFAHHIFAHSRVRSRVSAPMFSLSLVHSVSRSRLYARSCFSQSRLYARSRLDHAL